MALHKKQSSLTNLQTDFRRKTVIKTQRHCALGDYPFSVHSVSAFYQLFIFACKRAITYFAISK